MINLDTSIPPASATDGKAPTAPGKPRNPHRSTRKAGHPVGTMPPAVPVPESSRSAKDLRQKRTDDPDWFRKMFEGHPGVSGCCSGHFTEILFSQVHKTLPNFGGLGNAMIAIVAALKETRPADPLEGMLAGQMIGLHAAAMECLRRAMLQEQSFEGREMNLNQANKLVRSYAALLETLDKHRGKGQQTVRVEHVTVQAGGQAVVGVVSQRGEGSASGNNKRPHTPAALAHEPSSTLRSPDPDPDPEREPVPVTCREG
jgi:hypothetical protein